MIRDSFTLHRLVSFFHLYSIRILLALFVSGIFLLSCDEKIEADAEASIESLTLTVDEKDYTVQFTDTKGTFTVPYGTVLPNKAVVKSVVLSKNATGIRTGSNLEINTSGVITVQVAVQNGDTKIYTITAVPAAPSKETSVVALTLIIAAQEYPVAFTAEQATLTVPYSVTLPSAVTVHSVTLSPDATGVTADNKLTVIQDKIMFTITAQDGTTKKPYTITLLKAPPNTGSSIEELTLTVANAEYPVTFKDNQAALEVPFGTVIPEKVTVALITLSPDATGVAKEDELAVTDGKVNLMITAQDGIATTTYTVALSVALNTEAFITTLTLTVSGADYPVQFTDAQANLDLSRGVTMPAKVTVQSVEISSKAGGISQGEELAVVNDLITVTITAEDGTTQVHTITLTESPGIITFAFELMGNEAMALEDVDRTRIVGTVDQEAKTITFDKQSAYVYLDKLKPTFTLSGVGAVARVAGVDQTSAVTEQDFSSEQTYEVRTPDGSTVLYKVLLTKDNFATIPDPQFLSDLQGTLQWTAPDAFTGDQLDITHTGVTSRAQFIVLDQVTPTDIVSLKGIEFFVGLTALNCTGEDLTSLDLRKNTALVELRCGDNELTSLDVSNNLALEKLICIDNKLPSLDVTQNTNLTVLVLSQNKLVSLDVTNNIALTGLNCINNDLTSLDIRKNPLLVTFVCRNNALTSLDLSAQRNLPAAANLFDIGSGVPEDNQGLNNPLTTLRVYTEFQDFPIFNTIKTNRGTALIITTVKADGTEDCPNYTPAVTTAGGVVITAGVCTRP